MDPRGDAPEQADQDDERQGSVFLVPRVGTSGNAGEYVEPLTEGIRVGLFGALPGVRSSALQARAVVEAAMARGAQEHVSQEEALVLEEIAIEVDLALRHAFSPVDPDGKGTVVLAFVDHIAPILGWTGQGAAYLVREDGFESVEGGGDAHVGGRPRDASEVEIRVTTPNWRMRRLDRLVLATRPLIGLFSEDELRVLARQGSAEAAAQSIAAIAQVRCAGEEVGVAVFEISVNAESAELDSTSTDFSALLDTLSQVIPGLATLEEAELEARASDVASAPTDGFAPIRHRFPERDEITLVPDKRMEEQGGVARELPELVSAPATSPDGQTPDEAPVENLTTPRPASESADPESLDPTFDFRRVSVLVGALALAMFVVCIGLFMRLP